MMVDSLKGIPVGAKDITNVRANGIDSIKALRFQHHCVSSIGGFLGAYAILNYHDMLASAQTSNLIHVVLSLLGGDVPSLLARMGALVVYLLGFFITVYVPKFTKLNLQSISLVVDAFAVVLMALMPSGTDDVIALYPIFFAMAIQWSSFAKVEDYTSSTIFSTNNLKQATTSLMEYLLDGRKDSKKVDKSKFFGGTILGYHLGVALAFCSYQTLGSVSIWVCFVTIAVSLVSHIRVRKSTR